MLFKFIKKLTLYIFPTADDQKFYSLVKGSFFKSEEEPVLTTLVDCTHLGFKRWNIELLFTLSGISRVHNRNFIAFYPSYFFIWNTLQSKMVWLIKKIYNKDNHIFNLFFISEKIAPSYFKFLFSNYEFNEFNEFNEFLSKDEVLNFKYKGVKIGDLVYDSYLKENRKATVDIKSKELAFIIKKACFLVDFYQNEFSKYNIKEFYITHANYICYGAAIRVALKNNIKVFCTHGVRGGEFHQLTEENPFISPDFKIYKKLFDKLENPDVLLELAKKELENIFKGTINSSIDYLKETPYKDATIPINVISDKTDNLLIMLHCFFDSPHIYKSMLYPDFYEWVVDTIQVALGADKAVFIKEHPNGMLGNDIIVSELKKKFSAVTFLDKTTSNLAIMHSKIDAVVTVYGTLGHEFPYMDIPVINAGDNPHSAFNFCYNPASRSQYQDLIMKVGALKKPTNLDKIDILKFYYIHYISDLKGVNKLTKSTIAAKFSPKDDYKEMIDVINNVGINNFIEASKNTYLAVIK
jgi:hypothetical protein